MKHNLYFVFSLISLFIGLIGGTLINVWIALSSSIIACFLFVMWAYCESKNQADDRV